MATESFGINITITGTLEECLKKRFSLSDDELAEVQLDGNYTVQQLFTFGVNQANIFRNYTKTERDANNGQASINLVKAGTEIRLPNEWWNVASAMRYVRLKNELDQYNPSNPAEVLTEYVVEMMLKTSKMVKAKRDRHSPTNTNETIETSPVVRAFVLSRVLNGDTGSDRLINISAYVMSSVVSVGGNGGKFNLVLDGMTASAPKGYWDTPEEASNVMVRQGSYGKEYTSDTHTHRDVTQLRTIRVQQGDVKDAEGVKKANNGQVMVAAEPYAVRNEHAFSMLISAQDMVFIKFDPMDSEMAGGYRERDLLDPFADVKLSDFKDDMWDMIGLVDKVDESGSIADANVTISVSGRDMMKLMIEDGVYFFPITSVDGYQTNYFANAQDTRTYRRLLGEIKELALFVQKPVTELLKFIYKKLSTVEMWPDSTFNSVATNKDAVGVWKMTELVVDDAVGNRILYDQGLRTQSGTILSFMQSICQSPFMEFYGDTYGNRYAFIARRPPYTLDDIKKVFDACGQVTITESEIDDIGLDMSDEETFSWYRIVPQGFLFGDANMAMFYFPAIYFEEYAKIFGARKMEFESKFLDYSGNTTAKDTYAQVLKDLQYVIESYAYLPFTRKGTIKIRNNRRIKRGTWIYVQGTDELCYVEDVNYSSSTGNSGINADTLITVSRCMKRRHLEKYFAIIDFPKPETAQLEARSVSWRVNRSVFDWFVAKKQFVS